MWPVGGTYTETAFATERIQTAMEFLKTRMPNALLQLFRYRFFESTFSRFEGRPAAGLRRCAGIALMAGALQMQAFGEPVPVRHVLGTVHGFLIERGEDSHIVASGDSVQVAHGDQVTCRTTFTYKDGSVDDETTVFSQRHSFRLITDHHVQKGPFFPHPMDLMVDTRTNQVTVKTTGKDGKEQNFSEHMNLPLDVANGMVSQMAGNLKAGGPAMTVSLVVTTPKPRLVKLVISPLGEENFSIGSAQHKAVHSEIKIIIGGVVGLVAPLVGKAPPVIQIWEVGGEAPTFVKETGPTFEDGPVFTIELASPEWAGGAKGNG